MGAASAGAAGAAGSAAEERIGHELPGLGAALSIVWGKIDDDPSQLVVHRPGRDAVIVPLDACA